MWQLGLILFWISVSSILFQNSLSHCPFHLAFVYSSVHVNMGIKPVQSSLRLSLHPWGFSKYSLQKACCYILVCRWVLFWWNKNRHSSLNFRTRGDDSFVTSVMYSKSVQLLPLPRKKAFNTSYNISLFPGANHFCICPNFKVYS